MHTYLHLQVFNYKKTQCAWQKFSRKRGRLSQDQRKAGRVKRRFEIALQNANHTLDFSFVGERNGEDWLGEIWVKFG